MHQFPCFQCDSFIRYRMSTNGNENASNLIKSLLSTVQFLMMDAATITSEPVHRNKQNMWTIRGPNTSTVVTVHYEFNLASVNTQDMGNRISVKVEPSDDYEFSTNGSIVSSRSVQHAAADGAMIGCGDHEPSVPKSVATNWQSLPIWQPYKRMKEVILEKDRTIVPTQHVQSEIKIENDLSAMFSAVRNTQSDELTQGLATDIDKFIVNVADGNFDIDGGSCQYGFDHCVDGTIRGEEQSSLVINDDYETILDLNTGNTISKPSVEMTSNQNQLQQASVKDTTFGLSKTVIKNQNLIRQRDIIGNDQNMKNCCANLEHLGASNFHATKNEDTMLVLLQGQSTESSFANQRAEMNFHQLRKLKALNRCYANDSKPYICSICDKTFSYMSGLNNHEKVHRRGKYECSVCNKKFTYVGNLKVHERCHTGERPYRCSLCDKTFAATSNLISHQRVHTREKPYECLLCKKKFAHLATLQAHERSHTGERPYHCSHCDKKFSALGNLINHKRVHTRETPTLVDVAKTVCFLGMLE